MDKDRLRVKGITEQKWNQTRFVWLPQLLSATFQAQWVAHHVTFVWMPSR